MRLGWLEGQGWGLYAETKSLGLICFHTYPCVLTLGRYIPGPEPAASTSRDEGATASTAGPAGNH